MQRAAILLLCLTAVAFPLSKAYDTDVYGNCVATQAQGVAGISQYYRNTLDSLTAVSVWLGPAIASGSYSVVVYDSAGGPIAHNTSQIPLPTQWGWVSIPLTKYTKPVRGRTYKVVVTRSAGEITFAYDPTDPYKYGHAVANGSSMPGRLGTLPLFPSDRSRL